MLILDYQNHDPQIYLPHIKNYWQIMNQRTVLFDFCGLFFLCFVGWIFYMRISKG